MLATFRLGAQEAKKLKEANSAELTPVFRFAGDELTHVALLTADTVGYGEVRNDVIYGNLLCCYD